MPLNTEQKIDIIYQAVVGIDGNPDENGLLGECKEMKTHLAKLNGDVARNTTARKIITWLGSAVILAVIAMMIDLFVGG